MWLPSSQVISLKSLTFNYPWHVYYNTFYLLISRRILEC